MARERERERVVRREQVDEVNEKMEKHKVLATGNCP
jgi:hypothetical protein